MDNTSDEQQIQILKNIEQLQSMEKDLYKELEAPTPPANASSIINRINQLSEVRISLFKSLNETYISLQQNVNNTQTQTAELLKLVKFVEGNLNTAKSQLNQLYQVKDNKMRMVEINTYFGKQYMAQGKLLQLTVIVGGILLILAILWKKGFIPESIAKILIGVVLVVGGFLIIRRLLDITSRDNMNFDAYNWNFDPATQTPTVYEYDKAQLMGLVNEAKNSIPSFNSLDCVGDECCTEGMKYDAKVRKCIKTVAPETFVTGQLTKHCFNGPVQKRNRGGDGSNVMPYEATF